jgi:hypothetical protein
MEKSEKISLEVSPGDDGVCLSKMDTNFSLTDDKNKISREEINFYARQMILPEISLAGQIKLKNARVLCIGAGGNFFRFFSDANQVLGLQV